MKSVCLLATFLICAAVQAADQGRELLQAICTDPSNIGEANWIGNTKILTCNVCPPQTSFAGTKESLQLLQYHLGSFSGVGKLEAVLVLHGCEDHAAGFGGLSLVRKEGTTWRKIFYTAGFSIERCISYTAKSGVDELFCEIQGGFQGNNFASFIQIKVNDQGAFQTGLPGTFQSNDAGGSIDHDLCYSVMPESWKVLESPHGLKIEILVSATKTPPPTDPEHHNCVDADYPAVTHLRILLEYDGNTFVVAPESQKDFATLENYLPPDEQ